MTNIIDLEHSDKILDFASIDKTKKKTKKTINPLQEKVQKYIEENNLQNRTFHIKEGKLQEEKENLQVNTKKASIVAFPKLGEYIEIFERVLNNSKKPKNIIDAMLYIDNKLEKLLNNPERLQEKFDAIVNFVEYFDNIVEENEQVQYLLEQLEEEPLCYHLANYIIEQQEIEEGFEIYQDMEDYDRYCVDKIVHLVCNVLRNETEVYFCNLDGYMSASLLFENKMFEKHLEEKKVLLKAKIASCTIDYSVIFIHELTGKNSENLYGFLCNTDGIYSILEEGLKDAWKDEKKMKQKYKVWNLD